MPDHKPQTAWFAALSPEEQKRLVDWATSDEHEEIATRYGAITLEEAERMRARKTDGDAE